jgi:hypothetical protein
MYECYKHGIVEGRDSFPPLWIIGENLLYVATWVAAGWLLLPAKLAGWPVATIGWALFVVTLQVLLKKHNCSGCFYYGKSCHLGWGRLAAMLFPPDSGEPKMGMRLAVPMYMASPPLVLVAAVVLGVLLPVGLDHWIVLGVYVALNAASFSLRKVGCAQCKMRAVCPGSAAKTSGSPSAQPPDIA